MISGQGGIPCTVYTVYTVYTRLGSRSSRDDRIVDLSHHRTTSNGLLPLHLQGYSEFSEKRRPIKCSTYRILCGTWHLYYIFIDWSVSDGAKFAYLGVIALLAKECRSFSPFASKRYFSVKTQLYSSPVMEQLTPKVPSSIWCYGMAWSGA